MVPELEADCEVKIFSKGDINCPEQLADEFFRWMEYYHPIKEYWEKSNQGNENYPYKAFRAISVRRLEVMIMDYISEQKNKG